MKTKTIYTNSYSDHDRTETFNSYVRRGNAIDAMTDRIIINLIRNYHDFAEAFNDDENHSEMRGTVTVRYDEHDEFVSADFDEKRVRDFIRDELGGNGCYAVCQMICGRPEYSCSFDISENTLIGDETEVA